MTDSWLPFLEGKASMLRSTRIRRLVLVVLLIAMAFAISYEQAMANALDSGCGTICKNACAFDDGCRYFETVGCACKFLCNSGKKGISICASSGE